MDSLLKYVSPLISALGHLIPPSYLDKPCPWCKVEAGESCRTNFGKARQAHPVRRK